MLTGSVIISELFTVWTVTKDNWTDHPSCQACCSLFGSFSFFSLCTVLELRTVKPVERQIFFKSVWEQFLFMFVLFLFYVYAAKPYDEEMFWKLEATRNGCGYVESLQTF